MHESRASLPARPAWVDFVAMVILLLVSIYVVYFSTQNAARVFFILALLLFMFTKNDYLWFAFFFVIASQPGWLFSDFGGQSTTRLPLISFAPGASFTPIDLFLLFAFGKALAKGRRANIRLKKSLTLILLYTVFLFFLSFLIYGVDLNSFLSMWRSIFVLSIFISFLYLLHSREYVIRFLYLIFPVVFFVLGTQLHFIITGEEFINLLSPGYRMLALMESGIIRPVAGGTPLVFFCYVLALFLLQNARGKISIYYLLSIVMVSFLSVFLSATRVWFVMSSFVIVCYVIFSRKNIRRFTQVAIVTVVVIFFSLQSVLPKTNLLGAWSRISEIGSIAQGEFYKSSSFDHRFEVRLPPVLDAFKENWLFGWGFSETYYNKQDGHVGNFNLLLQVGVIGFLFFVYFWVDFFKMIFVTRKKLHIGNAFRNSLLILAYAFGAILIGHFSTYYFFGLYNDLVTAYFIATFVAIAVFFVSEAYRENVIYQADYVVSKHLNRLV